MAYDSSFWATEKAQFKTHCKTQKDHFNNMNTQTHTCLPQYLKMQAIHEVKQKGGGMHDKRKLTDYNKAGENFHNILT